MGMFFNSWLYLKVNLKTHLTAGYVYTIIPDSFFPRLENHTGYRATVNTSEHVQCFRRDFCNEAKLPRADSKLESGSLHIG